MTNPFVRALADDRPLVPIPWPTLARLVAPPPGTLVTVLGAPGVGKSLLSLIWALDINRPSRLVSLDTDSRTQAARVIAHLQNRPYADVLRDRARHAEWLGEQKFPMKVLDRSIQARELHELVEADTMFWGEPPSLVVVDDTSKVVRARDFEAYDELFGRMHVIAREWNTVLVALHHLHRGGYGVPGKRPVNLTDGRYSGEGEAEIVIGLWRPLPTIIRVGVLKNRFGLAAGDGSVFVDLIVDDSRAQLYDQEQYDAMLLRGDFTPWN